MQQVLKWFNSRGLSYPMLNVKGLSWLELSVGFFLWVLFNWFEQYTCSSLLNQSHMLASSQYMSPSKSPDYCLYRFFFCLCFLKSINREYIGNFSCIIVITWWAGQRGGYIFYAVTMFLSYNQNPNKNLFTFIQDLIIRGDKSIPLYRWVYIFYFKEFRTWSFCFPFALKCACNWFNIAVEL